MATDLCKVTAVNGQPGVRAVSLPDNVALITAWSNDAAYDQSFAGPLRAYLEPGDVLIAISASGRSPNVLKATRLANERGASTLGLTGFGGGELVELAQTCLVVDAHDYGLVEDVHRGRQPRADGRGARSHRTRQRDRTEQSSLIALEGR